MQTQIESEPRVSAQDDPTQSITISPATVVAGMLAAILPARRASRLNVLEALQYE